MYCWIEAYGLGLGTQDAQALVWNFSATKYKSHRRIPEAVCKSFDKCILLLYPITLT